MQEKLHEIEEKKRKIVQRNTVGGKYEGEHEKETSKIII